MSKKKIKIAVIAPPFTTIPPNGQGGTERIIEAMVDGLQKRGYEITLFGAGKYQGSARFTQIFKKTISEINFNSAKIESSRCLRMETVYLAKVMEEIIKRQNDFNLILNHARAGYLFLPLSRFLTVPMAHILHLPLFDELSDFLSGYKKPNIITISDSQRKGFSGVNYLGTVYNGVDIKEFEFCPLPKDYFLFMGAMGEHKNPKDAILSAKAAGVKLILAGGKRREPYFSKDLQPLIDKEQIKDVGEVAEKTKLNLLKYARALLFPISWEEPFGLVMIEAMACGTPVIAYPHGAVKEVVEHKKTGFIVNNVQEMVQAIKNINMIDRKRCRERVEKYFTTEKMIDNYETIIKKLMEEPKAKDRK